MLRNVVPYDHDVIPRHWYPYSRENWLYVTETIGNIVKGFVGSPTFWSAETCQSSLSLANVKATLPHYIREAFAREERRLNVCRRDGLPEEDLKYIIQRMAYLKGLPQGVVGPDQFVDDRMTFDIGLRPRAAMGTEDPWRLIDGMTGGCCSGARERAGQTEYVARGGVGEIETFERDARFQVISVGLDLPQGGAEFLSSQAQRLLAQYPNELAIQKQMRDEYAALEAARIAFCRELAENLEVPGEAAVPSKGDDGQCSVYYDHGDGKYWLEFALRDPNQAGQLKHEPVNVYITFEKGAAAPDAIEAHFAYSKAVCEVQSPLVPGGQARLRL